MLPGVARSAQPYLGFYGAFLRAHRIRSIINLRGDNPKHGWWHDERALAARLGIRHFDVRLSTRSLPGKDRIVALFDAFCAGRASHPDEMLGRAGPHQSAPPLFLIRVCKGAAALDAAERAVRAWPYLHRAAAGAIVDAEFPAFAVEDAAGVPLADWSQRYIAATFRRLAQRARHGCDASTASSAARAQVYT